MSLVVPAPTHAVRLLVKPKLIGVARNRFDEAVRVTTSAMHRGRKHFTAGGKARFVPPTTASCKAAYYHIYVRKKFSFEQFASPSGV